MTERSKNNIRETGGVFGGLRRVVGKYFQYGNSRRTRRMRREVTIDRSLLMTETAHDVPVNSVADAMGIAVVNRCVQLISGAVSSLPLRLLACGADGVFAAVPEGDANNLQYLLSVQPNDRDSAVELWARAVQQMLLLGNAYIIPRYFESAPYALMELRLVGADASVVYDRYSETYTVTDLAQGLSGRYAEGDIVRLSCPSYDGTPVGVGLIVAANTALRTVATADREMLRRFANGCMPTGFITNPRTVEGYGEVQDEELDRLAGALRYNMRHGDYLNVLYGNAEFHGVQMTAQDAQFVQIVNGRYVTSVAFRGTSVLRDGRDFEQLQERRDGQCCVSEQHAEPTTAEDRERAPAQTAEPRRVRTASHSLRPQSAVRVRPRQQGAVYVRAVRRGRGHRQRVAASRRASPGRRW